MAVIHRSSMPGVLDTEVIYDELFGIWSSPNVSSLRYPVPVYDMEIPSNIRLSDLRQPRWLSNIYPFIAFWPKSVDFNGPIFSRLDVCDRTISMEKAGPLYYRLHSDIITSWSRLERALEGLAKFLLSKGHHNAELGLLPLPRDCGYTMQHKEPRFVYHCAYKSRDAFVALSTVCSFAIASLMDERDHVRDEALWVKECRLQGVHPQWLEDLQRSFICNFTPGFRVGAYVNGYLSTWAKQFPAFKTGNVPLLIWWGHEPNPVRDQACMKHYLPRKEEVERAMSAYRALPIPQPREHLNCSYNDYEPNDSFTAGTPSANEGSPPEPVPGSHQQLGETLQGFLDRVKEELAEYAATEDIYECIARVEAEQRADNEQRDSALSEPTVGSAIYEWKWVAGGHQLRTFVPRQEWKTRWSFSSAATRWFHGLMNEWSIQVDKSVPNDNPATIFDHGNDFIGEREPQSSMDPVPVQAMSDGRSSSVILPRTLNTTARSAEVYAEDVAGLYGDLVSETKVVSHSLKDILHKRYGFMAEVPYRTDVRMKQYKSVANECHNLRSALNRIGLKEFHEDFLAQAGVDLYNFVAGNGSVPVAFPPLWDVAPSFRDQIQNHSRLSYNNVDDKTHLIGIRTTAFEVQWYLILVPDASTVLQVFREDDVGVLAAVRSLLDWGIPFNTVRCVDKKPKMTKRMNEKNIGLGYRDKQHRFDRQEYAAYEKRKQDILKKGYGRAARMAGGILWRLAQDVVSEKAVTRGPSTSVSVDGSVLGSMKRFHLVDDALSSSEMDIICGVYFVGKVTNQDSHLSWWPKHNTWETCGLNVGYWTADCEAWYQRRLAEIKSGNAELHSATDWKHRLKYRSSITHTFRKNTNTLASMVLDGRYHYWKP